jgi:hypothetical protein
VVVIRFAITQLQWPCCERFRLRPQTANSTRKKI